MFQVFLCLVFHVLRLRPQKNRCLVPYFWVKSSGEADAVHLELVWKTLKGVKFRMLVNTKKIEEHVQLGKANKELLEVATSSKTPQKKRKAT